MEGERKGRPGCWMKNANILENGIKLKTCYVGRTERGETDTSYLPFFIVPVYDHTPAAANCGCFLFSQPCFLISLPDSLEVRVQENV